MIVGVETRSLPSPTGSVPFCAVLVQGEIKDLACYVGVGPAEFVAAEGDKVSLGEAESYFPAIRSEMKVRGLMYRGPR